MYELKQNLARLWNDESGIIVLVSVVVFVVVMVLVHIHSLFERRASKGADGEPLVTTTEPNRRNQSATPPKVTASRTAS